METKTVNFRIDKRLKRNFMKGDMRETMECESDAVAADRVDQSGFASESGEAVCVPKIQLWKRALDLTIVAVTSIIWLPIFLVSALWVRMVSSGPVFFKQVRIGAGEVPFTMLKLRTMKVGSQTASHEKYVCDLIAADAEMTKMDVLGDPRLIPGARILRMLSIDEIPQFFNVLQGTMSVVGPRPCTEVEFERYLPQQKERFSVHSGLTGQWQVFGKNRTTFSEMIGMDIDYARNHTFGGDLLIILMTPLAILKDATFSLKASLAADDNTLETHDKTLGTHTK